MGVPFGLCKACGYQLRGITGARCPECGNAFDPEDPSTFDVAGLAPAQLRLLRLRWHAMPPLIVLAALLSSFGGPVALFDLLEGRVPLLVAFGVVFFPILIMLVAALSLVAPVRDRWERLVLAAGIASAIVVLSMHLWGAWYLAGHPRTSGHTLDTVATVAGIIYTCGFTGYACRALRRTHTRSP